MDFEEAERRFYELKGRLDTGRITPQEYQSQLRALTVQAADGRTWMIGGQTGRWYYFDGGSWVQGEPRRPAPPPQPAAVKGPEACARCGQPVPPGRSLCERCDMSLGAPVAAPPPPPPVATRAQAAPAGRPAGGRPGWVAGVIVAVVVLLACGGLAAAATLLPGSPLRGLLPMLGALRDAHPAAAADHAGDRDACHDPTLRRLWPRPPPRRRRRPARPLFQPPRPPRQATNTPAPSTATPTPPPPTATPLPPTATAGPPTATRTPTAVPTPAVTGRISYTVYDPASRTDNIYVINADGTGATQLISQGIAPSVAPDGRIVFHSLRSDQLGLVIRHPDGTTRYPRNYEVLHEDEMPFWSPDASRIALAFGTNPGDKPWRLVVMNADGTGRHDLAGFNGKHPELGTRRPHRLPPGLQPGGPVRGERGGRDAAPAGQRGQRHRGRLVARRQPGGLHGRQGFHRRLGDLCHQRRRLRPEEPDQLAGHHGCAAGLAARGKHLAFRSNRGGVWGLWVMNDDGSGAVRIAQAELDTSRLEDRMSAQ